MASREIKNCLNCDLRLTPVCPYSWIKKNLKAVAPRIESNFICERHVDLKEVTRAVGEEDLYSCGAEYGYELAKQLRASTLYAVKHESPLGY